MLSLHLFSLVASLILWAAAADASQIYGLPRVCELELMRLSPAVARDVIDWRPYAHHLRALGYDQAFLHRILSTNDWDRSDHLNLRNLTHWSLRRDVDVSAMVASRILNDYDFSSDSGRRDLKLLLRQVPFWLDREDRRGLVERLVKTAHPRDLTRIFLGSAPGLDPRIYGRLINSLLARFDLATFNNGWKVESLLIHLLALVPWSEIRVTHQELAERYWIDLRSYPIWTTNRIYTRAFGLSPTGQCPNMTEGHLRALGLTDVSPPDGARRIVKVGGRVVGAIKGRDLGDPSMVALRNVMDDRGRLVLALGGVYELPYPIVTNARSETIELDSLGVGPSDFLMNNVAWDGDAPESILEVFMSSADAHEAIEREIEQSEAEGRQWINASRLQDRFHEEAHAALLWRLDTLRKNLESE